MKSPSPLLIAHIEGLSHDGRGVTQIDGKKVFVEGALPGERVSFQTIKQRKHFNEAQVVEILEACADRVTPRCQHFGICGGCSLQHLAVSAQIKFKQQQVLDNLQRIGKVVPMTILPPVTSESWGYRHRARLSVKYVFKKERVLIGFSEKHTRYLADITTCEVLHPHIGQTLPSLAILLGGLSIYQHIPQIEVVFGDQQYAIIIRHLAPLTDSDAQQLSDYGEAHDLIIYTQSKGLKTTQLLWPETLEALSYCLPQFNLALMFAPHDFTQVNSGVNRSMVAATVEQLALQSTDTVLELFCGMGNFSLVLAQHCEQVTAVEGAQNLVDRASLNAAHNAIDNVTFFSADLTRPFTDFAWAKQTYTKMLLDPPRSGAWDIVQQLSLFKPERIVYISCNPATLARDAEAIVHQHGYQLTKMGVMDMFPHTSHIEVLAVFDRNKRSTTKKAS